MSKIIFSSALIVATFWGCFVAFGQSKKLKPSKKPATTVAKSGGSAENINKKDEKNRKQGMWFFSHAALRGEPAFFEFGSYIDDLKTGLWYKLDAERRPMAIENFYKGVLNGTAQYFEDGHLSCIGNYRGLNPNSKIDSIWVTNPETYIEEQVAVAAEVGSVKHGIWRYYNPQSGRLVKEEEYQVDNLIHSRTFDVSNKTDSLRIQKRNNSLPHQKSTNYQPPANKQVRYTY